MSKKKMKLCFAASSGGHFEQLTMLRTLMDRYDSIVVTEKTDYAVNVPHKLYYLKQVNRHEKSFPILMIINGFISLYIMLKERPDAVICTGVLATVPLCLLAKLLGKKLIYIESFAKINSLTETGKLLYKYADRFYVQWESMLKFYPNAEFIGGIY